MENAGFFFATSVGGGGNGTGGSDLGIGLGACGLATLCFGTMFVPLAGFNNGDGFFTQWCMGLGIWLVGLVVQAVRGWPPFQPLAMLGGALWAAGNVTAIPIINEVGMTIGILMWNLMNLVLGWASGRFGLFGWLDVEKPKSDLLNGIGMGLAVVSTLMFAFVKSRPPEQKVASEGLLDAEEADRDSVGSREGEAGEEGRGLVAEGEEVAWAGPERGPLGRLVWSLRSAVGGLSRRRLWAYALALLAGCFYGLNFAPVIHLQNKVAGASPNGLDYVFAHYSGILAASTAFFVVYAAWRQNRPFVNGRTALPGLVGGALWGVAEAAWFVANDRLDEAVSFPIISRFPGIVSALWGVLFFKEIQGTKNLLLLTAAIAVTLLGGLFSGLSSKISL